jgi:hypothetical protein
LKTGFIRTREGFLGFKKRVECVIFFCSFFVLHIFEVPYVALSLESVHFCVDIVGVLSTLLFLSLYPSF